jgi:hypothetical protein
LCNDLFSLVLQLMLHKVLLLGSKSQTIVGRPHVPKAAVFAVVEEHVRKKLRKTIHKVAISISIELASIDYSILSFYLVELIIYPLLETFESMETKIVRYSIAF